MVNGKRVAILTADAGFGHRSAANAVAAALQETYGDGCAVEIVNPMDDKRVPAVLRNSQADYDRIVRETPELYRIGYEATDAAVPSRVMESALTVMLFEVMRDLVREHRPDAIVTTYPLYQAPLQAVYALSRRHVPTLTVVTDLVTVHRLWFHEVADLCLVPTEQVRALAQEHGMSPEKVQITGIPVNPKIARHPGDRDALRAELGWRTDLATVLVVGGTRVSHLGDMLRPLNHAGLPLQLAILAGRDETTYRQLEETEWHAVAHLYGMVPNMPAMMHAADCVMCKAGGLIVTEALACGLPLLLIDVLPGQEAGNADYVVQGGAGELAQDPVAALEILYHWLEKDAVLLAERSENARRLGRPRAAHEIAAHAWAAAARGPGPVSRRLARARQKLVDLLSRHGVE
jgi:1,2-diacylglycerol 3-beta-galactosyltransferase